MKYLCADITKDTLAYGFADETGTMSEVRQVSLAQPDMLNASVQALHAVVRNLEPEAAIDGIALSVPYVTDPYAGTVYADTEVPLASLVQAACSLPCTVENSSKCAALGEYWLGAGQRSNNLFYLDISDTIHGAAVISGRILHGASFCAGEIGYMKIGSSVTFGEAASIQALIQNVAAARQVRPDTLDERKLFRQAKGGDAVATMAIRRLVDHLAAGIANICYLYNPDMVIIGGSLSVQIRYIRPILVEELNRRLQPRFLSHTHVTFSRLYETASLAGALYHFLHKDEHDAI